MPNNKVELDTERSHLSLQESSVQYRRIAPSSNSTAPNRPTKLLVDEIDMRGCWTYYPLLQRARRGDSVRESIKDTHRDNPS